MADFKTVFKRYELKYLMDGTQKAAVYAALEEHMLLDQYGHSTIRNIYLDTDNFLLARRSIDRPLYKEKLRFRSYGCPKPDGKIFVELKKKYKGVVYKRRLDMPLDRAMQWFADPQAEGPQSQIGAEIDFLRSRYPGIAPAMVLNYEREAYYPKESIDFRVTIDSNILARTEDLDLTAPNGGIAVLPEGYTLMEIKTLGGIPLWMTEVMDRCGLYKSAFTKYGNAYKLLVVGREPEEFAPLNRGQLPCRPLDRALLKRGGEA